MFAAVLSEEDRERSVREAIYPVFMVKRRACDQTLIGQNGMAVFIARQPVLRGRGG